MDALYQTQKVVQPPVGTSPKEKLHDVLHAKDKRTKSNE